VPERHRLKLTTRNGDPRQTAIEVDGEPVLNCQRVELVLDANGESQVRLTFPGALVDVDADVAAFVQAHVPTGDDEAVVRVEHHHHPSVEPAAIARSLARMLHLSRTQ